MGTTTKMAIPYPEATGLVKDGWEDMKDIATQVDAKSGLVLLNTTSFSAVSSQSVNNVFTSNFKNYRLVVNATSSQTSSQVFGLKMRASGTDTSTGYYNIDVYTGSATGPSRSYEANVARFGFGNAGNIKMAGAADLFSPQEAAVTGLNSFSFEASNSDFYSDFIIGYLNNTTSYDGFTIYVASGTITGTISTYGYNA